MLDRCFRTLASLAFGVVKPFTTDFSQLNPHLFLFFANQINAKTKQNV